MDSYLLMIDDIVNLEEDELRRYAHVDGHNARTALFAVGVNHQVVDDEWYYHRDTPVHDDEDEYDDGFNPMYDDEDDRSSDDGNCVIS